MRIRHGSAHPRMIAMGEGCIARRVHQNTCTTNATPMIYTARPDGEPRSMHVAPVAAAAGRKVKVLKSGVRRISY